jgi:hypothetical protein
MKRKRRARGRDATPIYEVECDPLRMVEAFDEAWLLATLTAESAIAALERAMPELPRAPTLLDRLIEELEAENLVAGDAIAERLDRMLPEARTLSKPARMQLQAQITELRQDAATTRDLRRAVHAAALEKVAQWEERAREAPPSFAEQARERARAAAAEAADLAEELAEYEATVEQLDAVYTWIDRIE